MEWFDGFFYTPGWGALMTLVGTLGGVALTQLVQAKSTTKQLEAAKSLRDEERTRAQLELLRQKVAEVYDLLDDYGAAHARFWHGLHVKGALTEEEENELYMAIRKVSARMRSGVYEILLLCRDQRTEEIGTRIRFVLGENLEAPYQYTGDDPLHESSNGPAAIATLLEQLLERTRELVSSDLGDRPTS